MYILYSLPMVKFGPNPSSTLILRKMNPPHLITRWSAMRGAWHKVTSRQRFYSVNNVHLRWHHNHLNSQIVIIYSNHTRFSVIWVTWSVPVCPLSRVFKDNIPLNTRTLSGSSLYLFNLYLFVNLFVVELGVSLTMEWMPHWHQDSYISLIVASCLKCHNVGSGDRRNRTSQDQQAASK